VTDVGSDSNLSSNALAREEGTTKRGVSSRGVGLGSQKRDRKLISSPSWGKRSPRGQRELAGPKILVGGGGGASEIITAQRVRSGQSTKKMQTALDRDDATRRGRGDPSEKSTGSEKVGKSRSASTEKIHKVQKTRRL